MHQILHQRDSFLPKLGSGTASSSTFLKGDSTFPTVNTDLVSDTSPQLGGDLQSNGSDIVFC
ncbi:MAG: hypothetical protein CM15mL2_0180 [Caudoviricetes sp.]|nr:MAG: hypothetical protein CM15mL2_0180 [Caudoviricetes sp.]